MTEIERITCSKSSYFKDAIHKNYESVHDLRLLNMLASRGGYCHIWAI